MTGWFLISGINSNGSIITYGDCWEAESVLWTSFLKIYIYIYYRLTQGNTVEGDEFECMVNIRVISNDYSQNHEE